MKLLVFVVSSRTMINYKTNEGQNDHSSILYILSLQLFIYCKSYCLSLNKEYFKKCLDEKNMVVNCFKTKVR
jgi:hypothetical protein